MFVKPKKYTSDLKSQQQTGAGFTTHANLGKGSSTENTSTHTNTTVQVAGATHNDIAGNFTLDGANLTTKHLTGTLGGDLIVKSRQDTYQYDSKQQNISGSADIDFSGKLQNANINAGKQQLNAQYAQVTNQSGIIANTSSLNVQGQGKFTGGYLITDANQNHTQFKQGIQTQDIHNHLNYQGDALQVGVSIAPNSKESNTDQQDSSVNKANHKLGLSGLGYGKIDPIHKTSITKSAITDQAGLSHINTGNLSSQDSQQALNPIISNDFTNQKSQLEKELGGQVTITTEFGREIPKQIGDYAQAKEIELLAQSNIEEAQKWAEGGVYRVALHTTMGALATGTAEGAFATGGVAAAAPQIEKLETILTEKLANDDSPESKHKAGQAAKAIISTALLTLGETSGLDVSSTMMATNVEVNNRWLHDNEVEKIFGKDGAKLKQFAKEQGITYEEAWRAVLAQAYRNADDNFRKAHQTSATAKEKKLSEAAENFLRKNGFHIVATPQEQANSQQNINNTKYKALLNSVINNTPKQTQQQVNQTVLTQTAKTSAVGAAKGVGNIPSDTANSIANVFHKEVPQTFPYSNEEEANVGRVAQNVVVVATSIAGAKIVTGKVGTSRSQISLNWKTGISVRGKQWESKLEARLPSTYENLNNYKSNFKTFDFYDNTTQTAISAKSVDTVGSFNGKDGIKSLERQIKRYVDDTVKFKGDKSAKTGYKLESKDIKRREVHIAIPQGTSQAKMQAIQNAINYGETKSVKVVITVTVNE